MGYFVEAILPLALPQTFTYKVNKQEYDHLLPGMRIAVPFGKNRVYTALVQKMHQTPPQAYEAKEIEYILDDAPIITQTQLQHWAWISKYYMCHIGEVFKNAIPTAFLLESETWVCLSEDFTTGDESQLADDEYLLLEALQHQSALRITDITEILEKKTVLPVVNRMIKRGIVALQAEIKERYRPKMSRYVMLNHVADGEQGLVETLDGLKRAPKQYKTFLVYLDLVGDEPKPIKVSELKKITQDSGQAIKGLVKKRIFTEEMIQEDRIQYTGEAVVQPSQLNPEQELALGTIQSAFGENKVCLLHGVTSSGKTEVYVQLIKEALEKGEQVLYLLPEIALTTQLIQRLQKYFGSYLAVYHSKFNIQERAEVWQHVLECNAKAQLVIGARSSLFLPFQNLGLVIVDEEHEPSFKQHDPAPRYHARDAAIVLAKSMNAQVLLGSATPSLETYHNVLQGRYGLAEIKKRYGQVPMPDINLVDLKEQQKKKRIKGHFSEPLRLAMEGTLTEGKQIILFQNRRGFAPVMECTDCGHCPQCPNCDVSLTYHAYKRQLRCHYCGYYSAQVSKCHSCSSEALDTKGLGTEQIEQECQELFPDARVGRMDLDTTRAKHAHAKIIDQFTSGELDILVGTQMLSKGLDFKNVDLVGVLHADGILNFPDFRSHERGYQLLSQVSGRAGRHEKRGKVLIQTYNPYHQILQQVSIHDYESMQREQMYERRQHAYPPFARLIRVTFKHKDYSKLEQASEWFVQGMRNLWQDRVLGPVPPAVSRVRNQYIQVAVLKVPKGHDLATIKNSIKRIENSFNAIPYYRSVRIIFDVDPI
ncbi:replication restart helicase PriA [Sediminicola luteus]|uniref:Replication restart protein PriA n=1 Tax=Sediminicola luteus TaxID=319238 RepID=A0A2A4G3W4_9FLAO|nr:primosomal protein N' [Sediminicola luteus]PCE62415.1 primosomal protein N' [Sediminicola luteus]